MKTFSTQHLEVAEFLCSRGHMPARGSKRFGPNSWTFVSSAQLRADLAEFGRIPHSEQAQGKTIRTVEQLEEFLTRASR